MKLPRLSPLLLAELLVNLLLPWLLYTCLLPDWGERGALLWSALPPVAWSIVEWSRHRRLDAMSVLVLGGIVLSLLAMLGDGDSRWLLVRESLVSGAIGLLFVLSLPIKQPLVTRLALAMAARRSAEEHAHLQQQLQRPPVQRAMRQLTLLWGGGLLGECGLRIWLAFHWPVAHVIAVAPWLGYGIMALLAGLTWLWRRRLRAALSSVR